MSWAQRFFTAIVPRAWAASMEADSRAWKLICERCGRVQSFWEVGGIRWKAQGNQRTYRRCPACGQRSWQRTEYRPDRDGDGG
jgi:hypothetical protein